MSKVKNNYTILEHYICPSGYHYHPNHPKSDKNGCMKDEEMKENYGAFSIGGALKTPFRYPENEKLNYPGV